MQQKAKSCGKKSARLSKPCPSPTLSHPVQSCLTKVLSLSVLSQNLVLSSRVCVEREGERDSACRLPFSPCQDAFSIFTLYLAFSSFFPFHPRHCHFIKECGREACLEGAEWPFGTKEGKEKCLFGRQCWRGKRKGGRKKHGGRWGVVGETPCRCVCVQMGKAVKWKVPTREMINA